MIPKYVEFVVIHLVFVRGKEKHLMMTRTRNKPSGTVARVSDWYFKILVKERAMLKPGSRERYREWRIFSGDESLFTMNNCVYEQAYIFLGEEGCYWIFFKNEPEHIRKEGTGNIKCSYCGCCIFCQYKRIVACIKQL